MTTIIGTAVVVEQSYLFTWTDSVENFFGFARELEVDEYTYELAAYLVKTQDDLDRFVELYDGDMDYWLETLYKMLPSKVN